MLICNLIAERYNQLKKEQYGIKFCTDTLYSMFLQQQGLDLGCSGVIVCYTPETCDNLDISCSSITINQDITYTCSSAITITQL